MRPHNPFGAKERGVLLAAAAVCLSIAAARAPARTAIGAPYLARAAQGQPPPAAKDLGQLRPGETRRQEIGGGEAHAFRVPLEQGQYLRAVVTQDGIDLAVSFFVPGTDAAAAGTAPAIIHMDSPNGSHGPESVSLIAPATGAYLLVVRSEERGAMPGRYEVRLEDAHAPTEADLQRVRAEAAYLEARRLRRLGTEESGKQAVARYAEALGLWRSLGDRYAEACTLYAIGQTYHRSRGRIEEARDNLTAALDFMNRALDIFRGLNDVFGQAMVDNDMGAALRDLDSPRKALPFYEGAYELYERAGDQWGKGQVQNNIGIAYALLGDFREALGHYEQSLPIWQAARDRNMEANAYNNIAGALEALGDPTQALAKYQQALSIWRETGSARLASAFNNVGEINHGLGDTQAAFDNYGQALTLYREQKNAGGEANVLNNVGLIYADMGDAQTALEKFNESLSLWQSLGQKRGQAQALDNMGYACYLLGRYDEALGHYRQAREIFGEVGDAQGESYALTLTGMIYAARGDTPKALDSYEQAKKIQEDRGLKLGRAITLDKIANAYASAGDPRRAADSFREALDLWVDLRAERGRAESLYGLARLERAQGNLAGARDLIGQAIKIVESLRYKTANQQLRTTLLASRHDYYELDVDVKMRLAEQTASGAFAEAAFESSEQGRARGLLDLLSEARADIRAGITPELAVEERELKGRLDAVSDRLLALRGSRPRPQDSARVSGEIGTLEREFDALSLRYDDLLARVRSRSPRYAQLMQPTPPKAAAIKGLIDPDTMLLEYALCDERGYLWAVTREGVEGYRLGGRAEIQQAAARLRKLIASYGSRAPGEGAAQYVDRLRESAREYRERAAELGRLILGPVAGRIGSKRLVVIADGELQLIPFDALLVPGAPTAPRRAVGVDGGAPPLGLTNEVVYLPSASTLALLRGAAPAHAAAKKVAVFADPVFDFNDERVAAARRQITPGDPSAAKTAALGGALRDLGAAAGDVKLERLRYTLEEADAITSIVPAGSAMKAVGFAASRANATAPAVADYRIVHFATHALLNDRRPELSGLVMSLVDERGRWQDGFLRLGDIYNLRLPADLVVLSACRTGVGSEVRGEGLIGLARGFMYAGAGSIVVSLWKVDDEATKELMKNFYRHMLKDGMPASAALRLAKSEVMQARDEWRAPYFWAGFVLEGDWRPPRGDGVDPKLYSSTGNH